MEELLFQKTNWEQVEGLVYSDLKHPFDVLGPHKTEDGIRICCFFPDASKVMLKMKKTGKMEQMARLDDAGVYGILLPGTKQAGYTYLVSYEDGTEIECEDPYAFSSALPEKELDLFAKGIHYEVYQMLGAHRKTVSGVEGVLFAVWAPNAMRVSVVGDFNLWDGRRHMMELQGDSGIFSLFIPGIKEGDLYKYEIRIKGGATVLKADPYASLSQKRPENASVVCSLSGFAWTDKEYLENRKKKNPLDGPMNIYEVHLGSWKKPTEEDGSFYNYRELAVMLADYVKEMGYTHIELMPVMEHPFDGSWGYQVTGYYSPTSRYGTPQDFMYFMDYMHQNGIGVILDWVPAHFPKDAFGLANFDGTCLYEHKDKRQGEHPHWGTLIYNYARPQVSNFLIANALYWVEQFHADGIRMDAVASMLYLDYGKNDGEWIANKYGGRENLDAIELLKHLNSIMKKRNKNVLMIAEESTAWPMITGDAEDGGLGFSLKWNMGWMNDFLQYMRQDPLFRKGVHGCLTFSMMYAYSERFLLVFSHDEVVHGKGSLINKMPGDYEQKFANLRAAYSFMTGHPGKKFLFMGQDFAQFAEWNEAKSLDWNLAEEYDMHKKFKLFCKELNAFYQENTALYEQDFVTEGFEWMSCMDADRSIVSFVRRGKKKGDMLLFVCNFTPVFYEKFTQAVPKLGKYKEVFNSDAESYGGTGAVNARQKTAKKVPCDGQEQSIEITLPPLGVTVFRFKEEEPKKPKKAEPVTEVKTAPAKAKKEEPAAEAKTVPAKAKKEEPAAEVKTASAKAKKEEPAAEAKTAPAKAKKEEPAAEAKTAPAKAKKEEPAAETKPVPAKAKKAEPKATAASEGEQIKPEPEAKTKKAQAKAKQTKKAAKKPAKK